MSEAKEVYEWFDGMGYDIRGVSLVRVAKDAWAEAEKRATAAERKQDIVRCEILARYFDDHGSRLLPASPQYKAFRERAIGAKRCAAAIREADNNG